MEVGGLFGMLPELLRLQADYHSPAMRAEIFRGET
jgi:hypothetical protein